MKTNKIFTLIILLLISSISYSQSNLVEGNVNLIGQTNHDSIMVVFERTAPSTTYDTSYTDVSGNFSNSIDDGIYSVHYSKNGYLTTTVTNQAIYAATTLPTQILELGGLSGSLSGIIQKGSYKNITCTSL